MIMGILEMKDDDSGVYRRIEIPRDVKCNVVECIEKMAIEEITRKEAKGKRLIMATNKQKKAIEKISENIRTGNTQPLGKVLKEVGYKESVTKRPSQVTKSKGFQELMDKIGLSDECLFAKHKQLLDKQEVVLRNNNTTKEIEAIPTGQIDVQAVKAALDMAYKLKGKYLEKIEHSGEVSTKFIIENH